MSIFSIHIDTLTPWTEPVTVGAVRMISGYYKGTVSGPVSAFVFQWQDGAAWKDIPGAAAQDNHNPYWTTTFAPVKTTKVRLCITKCPDDTVRLWEVELYGPVAPH